MLPQILKHLMVLVGNAEGTKVSFGPNGMEISSVSLGDIFKEITGEEIEVFSDVEIEQVSNISSTEELKKIYPLINTHDGMLAVATSKYVDAELMQDLATGKGKKCSKVLKSVASSHVTSQETLQHLYDVAVSPVEAKEETLKRIEGEESEDVREALYKKFDAFLKREFNGEMYYPFLIEALLSNPVLPENILSKISEIPNLRASLKLLCENHTQFKTKE